MTARRNEVELIARLAPRTIAFLQVPLTPARAARLADFTLRHNIDAQTLVIDLIDDLIFDMTPRCLTVSADASTNEVKSSEHADGSSNGGVR